LNENNYTYLVVNREQKRIFDTNKAITIETKSNSIVQIYKEISDDKTEARLYCYSERRQFKESTIENKISTEFEKQINNINDNLTKKRCKKDKMVIERRIGRLFEKYSEISQHYSVVVEDNSLSKSSLDQLIATKIILTKKSVAGSMIDKPEVYCLRSNKLTMTPHEMWIQYSRLTDIDSVFKSLKSDLGLRPIYHKNNERIESHLFITVLAYQCVHIIRNVLKESGIDESWWSIRNYVASHGRLTFVLPKKDGSLELIRKAIHPQGWQIDIYNALGITTRPGGTVYISRQSLLSHT
jgi:transposase